MKHCYKPTILGLLLIFCMLISTIKSAQAQFYYQPQTFIDPTIPPKPGVLGQLYNPKTYLITGAPTTYHGNRNVYATVYLPYVYDEWTIQHPLPEPFNGNYTTAIALYSPKDPILGLYAPVQVVGVQFGVLYPYSSIIPQNYSQDNYTGPFNTMPTLNSNAQNVTMPIVDEYGLSALEAAQNFTRFTHTLFKDGNGNGWDGFDKLGIVPITVVVDASKQDATFYKNSQVILCRSITSNSMHVDRATIGHEIAHGIIEHSTSFSPMNVSAAKDEMEEAFGDIMGLSFSNWMESAQFSNPKWEFFWEITGPGMAHCLFNDPQSCNHPSAWNGTYFQKDPLAADYDVHANGDIVKLAFYSVIEENEMDKDDKPGNGHYSIEPLIPESKEETYKLALQVFFKAFVEKLKSDASYHDLRKATLDALIDLGYPPESHAYMQMQTAWEAVNVSITPYNTACALKESETVFNGKLKFYAQDGTLSPDPQAPKISLLNECADANAINTYFAKEGNSLIDWNMDSVYSDNNNTVVSRLGVSVHLFSQLARGWFKDRFDFSGMDGSGKFGINNVIGDFNYLIQTYTSTPSGNSVTYNYPVKKLYGCRDEISSIYFSGIDFLTKYDFPNPSKPLLPEWKTITTSLAQIFALEIKKDYEKAQQNANADDIWTLYEDMSDLLYAKDFSNPKAYGQPAVYHGTNWNEDKPEINSGIINLFYYLLTHGAENGYTNDEPDSKTYTVHRLNKDLVLKVLWESYRQIPANSTIEEFRAMTMKVLHDMDPQYFVDKKTKEHIAFYDAWAAVLGLPDFASTLKHYPEDGATIYPWTAKVGVEVEYPLYESERLFEVSKSLEFDENIAPVHRFISSASPDLATSMTYGYVALEPGQTYYVRSRLSLSGDPRKGGCAATEDPVFCESLNGKTKWTPIYDFVTHEVEAITNLNPQTGAEIPAWVSPLSWKSVKGAEGYNMDVLDKSGAVPSQTLTVHAFYDENQPNVKVDTVLALAKSRDYKWSVVPWHRLGSEWEVHVLPNYMTYPFTDTEKKNFPLVYGVWSDAVNFKTDLPKIELKSPADGEHLSMMGPVSLSATSNTRADHYYYKFYYDGDQENPSETDQTRKAPVSDLLIQNLKLLDDQHVYAWTFAPMHYAAPPFITQDEMGAIPPRFHFKVDKSKIAKPNLPAMGCIDAGGTLQMTWDAVPGAAAYQFGIINTADNLNITGVIVGDTKTTQIPNVRNFPGVYIRKVSAGVKNYKGDWVFGPEASSDYKINPPSVTGLNPDNATVPFSQNNSITFTWNNPGNKVNHEFTLNRGLETIVQPQMVSGSTFKVENLEFSTDYQWKLTPLSSYGCSAPASSAAFRSQDPPFIPLLGINARTHDAGGAPLNSFKYSVTVTQPDGSISLDHHGLQSAGVGVLYQPLAQFPNDGTLIPMDGWYNIHIEITDVLQKDPKLSDGSPTWSVEVKSFDGAPALQSSNQPQLIDTLTGSGAFGGLTEGFSVDIPFHYNLKKLSK
ncbi:M4 family metallopeptidase [Dyadobacter sandarakinus]|uniref:M4 family metallopeptidase n=1 Tax=Dyadobacter sandarakinus TaxID=2747268 RepID=A0ABX7ICS6_9BACT|nr:M4 family metallopeptidase [Dyadobacter sandarakinus]QRR03267.1 M4 family metallopeptidase [Dyadobacter sandarakinus]